MKNNRQWIENGPQTEAPTNNNKRQQREEKNFTKKKEKQNECGVEMKKFSDIFKWPICLTYVSLRCCIFYFRKYDFRIYIKKYFCLVNGQFNPMYELFNERQ